MKELDIDRQSLSGLDDQALEQVARDLQAQAMARAIASGVAWMRGRFSHGQVA